MRAVDLAERLKVQSSSVTQMIQKLDEAGFISYEKYRNVALTWASITVDSWSGEMPP